MDSAIETPYDQVLSRPTPQPPEIVEREVNNILASAKVFVLDPDFMLVFVLAVTTDVLDIVLHPTVIGLVITIPIDIIIFFIMLAWSLYRGTKVENAKEEAQTIIEQYINAQEGKTVKTAKRLRMASTLARTKPGSKILTKVLKRVSLGALLSIIPFLGMIPWWTILVVLAFREKIELDPQET